MILVRDGVVFLNVGFFFFFFFYHQGLNFNVVSTVD